MQLNAKLLQNGTSAILSGTGEIDVAGSFTWIEGTISGIELLVFFFLV